jgi:hypothetical protein
LIGLSVELRDRGMNAQQLNLETYLPAAARRFFAPSTPSV